MIAYLDTSALVPLLFDEPTTAHCRRIWEDADAVVSSHLSFVEASSALARAKRSRLLTGRRHRECLDRLYEYWLEVEPIAVDEAIVVRAAALTEQLGLRAYDAVHGASAEAVNDADLIAAAGDRQLLDAWRRLGIATLAVTA